MRIPIDLENSVFGRLTAIARVNTTGQSKWECMCTCGNSIIVLANDLRRGHTTSCGCLHKEVVSKTGKSNEIPDLKLYIKERTVVNEDGCWEWISTLDSSGYGYINIVRYASIHKHRAYRLSYLLFNGTFDPKLLVCHKCDNPLCVNPEHLFVGTHKDNSNDMISKGRSARGSKNHKAILNEEQVIEILQSKGVVTQEELAKKFNVSRAAIGDIHSRRNWKHINV